VGLRLGAEAYRMAATAVAIMEATVAMAVMATTMAVMAVMAIMAAMAGMAEATRRTAIRSPLAHPGRAPLGIPDDVPVYRARHSGMDDRMPIAERRDHGGRYG